MTPEGFNRKCAEYMGLTSCGFRADDVEEFENEKGGSSAFDPYHDANDRNKVIEKMRITTAWNDTNNHWMTKLPGNDYLHKTSKFNMEMEAAQIACIEQVLESMK